MPNKQWHEIMNILQGQQGQILTTNSGNPHPCYHYHTTPVVLASATTTMEALFSLISLYLPQSPPLLWFRKRVKRFLSFTHAFSYILPVARKLITNRTGGCSPVAWKFLPSSTNRTEGDTFTSVTDAPRPPRWSLILLYMYTLCYNKTSPFPPEIGLAD